MYLKVLKNNNNNIKTYTHNIDFFIMEDKKKILKTFSKSVKNKSNTKDQE